MKFKIPYQKLCPKCKKIINEEKKEFKKWQNRFYVNHHRKRRRKVERNKKR